MKSIEFYNFGEDVWYRTADGKNEQLTEDSREIVVFMNEKIRELYPDAYKRIAKHFEKLSWNLKLQQFRIVRRFCKCNFGEIQQSPIDIDCNSRFYLEKVICPLRGDCDMENVVCNPKFNSRFSASEMRVLELLYRGFKYEEIAHKLCLAEYTCRNHVRNAFARKGFHEKAEFIAYAKDNKLFKDE